MAKQMFPSDQQAKFVLRLPGGMRDRIKDVAEKNGRSMNAEIIATLEKEYPAPAQSAQARLASAVRIYIEQARQRKLPPEAFEELENAIYEYEKDIRI